jgi:hypothetical protein
MAVTQDWGRHELTSNEQRLSEKATEQLGFRVSVYFDGLWICQPENRCVNGYGATAASAIVDCDRRNRKTTEE